MGGSGDTSKKIAIAVAVIGVAGTIGAALISNLHKSDNQPPTIQQSSSGDGAINVAHDAVINTPGKSPGEEAAERVQACEEHHGMKTANERVKGYQNVSSNNESSNGQLEFEFHTDYRSCIWPRTQYSDGDGYLEIKVVEVNGVGDSEASGTDNADRITAPCPQIIATYQYGHMGEYRNLDPIRVSANAVVTVDGKPWVKQDGEVDLPFYPETGEMVILASGHYGLESVKCAD